MVNSTLLPWCLFALSLLTSVGFFFLWRRARARTEAVERQAAQAERHTQQARREAQRNAAWLTALLQAQPDAVLIVSPQRSVQDWNPAAQALFGAPGALGQTLILVTRSTELDELVARALAGEADCDQSVALGLEAQSYRARVIRAGEFGAVLALQDQSELQRLGRARRDFVANISHELRTPLTAIRLLVENLQSRAPRAAEETADRLQKISAETRTLEQLAQELLDLAQIESGKTLVRLEPTALNALVAETVARFEPQATHKRQLIQITVPEDLVVLADREQLRRALGNLIHNALKFAPVEGQVWVRAERAGEDVRVEVADNGPGIPLEDVPRVFERFFRGDRSRAGGGAGLGLAIARHILEAHGGRIWVESANRSGARFRFTLLAEH